MLGLGSKYAALFASVVAMFINFVACGSQLYKMSLDGDTQSKAAESVGEEADPSSPNYGLHATGGWVDLPVHFRVSSELSEDQQTGLFHAMHLWEAAVGKRLFVFEGAVDTTGDTFKDLYSSLGDNTNGYYMDDNWAKTGKKPIVLATTIWNNLPSDASKIDQADIRFNSEYYNMGDAFTAIPTDKREIVDMQTLALHELGHMLGLAHIKAVVDPDSIMAESLYIGQGLANRRLSNGDISRIQRIYGCEADACDHDKVLAAIDKLTKADHQVVKSNIVENDTAH